MATFFTVTPQAVTNYEKGERAKTLTLATLYDCAGAIGCDVVYCLVPRNNRAFSQLQAVAREGAPKPLLKPQFGDYRVLAPPRGAATKQCRYAG